ncbi:MAG: type I-E CRISPR-associated protein Cas5/CasD [candidate division WOR-3 bacterium]
MKEYLLFRIYGPMASWGDIAVGEVRPSYTHPSKSAVLGLIAAALRIDRYRDDQHRALAQSYGFAVRVESMGIPLVDYHTVQVPRSTKRSTKKYTTRREELMAVSRDGLNTILSRRDYRMDALATVALWGRTSELPFPLTSIKEAMERPGYLLYLGRKSCPLALPMEAQIVEAETIFQAFARAKFAEFELLQQIKLAEKFILFWEEGVEAGIPAQHTFQRRDVPLSRRRWQFEVRQEYQGSMSEEV